MTHRATGTFKVNVAPLPARDEGANTIGRMSIDKTFEGDLQGTTRGEMLAAMTATPSSAVYVAIEHVTGTLNGRKGGFTLYHTGVMDRGTGTLAVHVVPDSGTGELVGLTGTMDIIVEGGKHSYVFEYSL